MAYILRLDYSKSSGCYSCDKYELIWRFPFNNNILYLKVAKIVYLMPLILVEKRGVS